MTPAPDAVGTRPSPEEQLLPVGGHGPLRLLGLLWALGGLLVTAWGVLGVGADGRSGPVRGAGAAAVVVGSSLLLSRRPTIPVGLAALLTLAGSAIVSAVVLWSGPLEHHVPAILFVYVAVYAAVALGPWAIPVIAASMVVHAAVLAIGYGGTWVASWLLTWGAALVVAVVIARAAHALAHAVGQRDAALAQLAEVDAAKTAFIRAVGHDLATPAGLIAGIAETVVVRDAQLDADRRRELLTRLAHNARRLQSDVVALLHLGVLSEGQVVLERTPAPLSEVIDSAVDLALGNTGAGAATVRIEPVPELTVAVDRAKLEHAIANLVSNAVKYAAAAGPIDVSAIPTPTHVVIQVADRGPGLPPGMHRVVFEPFVRGQEQDTALGTGVGLSIVRAFARLHGGNAWAEPREGGGLLVSLSISREPTAGPTGA